MFTIRTCSDALLSAFDREGNRIASLFADHVPREIAEHRRVLQGLKAELALTGSSSAKRLQLEQRREQLCERRPGRVRGVCSQAAAFVAGLVKRRGASRVHYDDRDRSYVEPFPWLQLQFVVKEKVDVPGAAFYTANKPGDVAEAFGPAGVAGRLQHPAAGFEMQLDRRSAG